MRRAAAADDREAGTPPAPRLALTNVSKRYPGVQANDRISLTVRAGLESGSCAIWKGPIVDQDGKTVLPAEETADDKFLHGIDFYVSGVQGKLPSSK